MMYTTFCLSKRLVYIGTMVMSSMLLSTVDCSILIRQRRDQEDPGRPREKTKTRETGRQVVNCCMACELACECRS